MTLISYPLIAEENTDKVILPETPPTIEYFRKTTLDKPVLQRLNFITDPEINSLPEVSVAEFKDFYEKKFPIYVGLGMGSYGAVEGDFLYTSTDSWHLGYKSSYTDGEIQQLRHRENVLDWAGDTFVADNFNLSGNLNSDEKTVWTQQKNFYDAGAGFAWYLRENMNLKTRFDFNKTEMKTFTDNRSQSADLSYDWQPFKDNIFSLYASGEKYSAFTQYNDFITTKGRYAVMPFSWVAIAAGGAAYKDKVYPEADITFHLFNYFRLNVAYDPGIETKTFEGLYFNNYYETPNYGIIFPEKTLSFREKLGCYINDNSSCEVEVSQANYKNYIYRSEIAGSEFVTLNNFTANDIYVTKSSLIFKNVYRKTSQKLQFTYNSDKDMPFVPEFTASAALGFNLRKWSITFGYDYTAKMYYDLNNTSTLPASGNLSFLIGRNIAKDTQLTLKFDNLLSDTIESQLDFIRKSPAVEAGVRTKF